jgi:hypothetical protein
MSRSIKELSSISVEKPEIIRVSKQYIVGGIDRGEGEIRREGKCGREGKSQRRKRKRGGVWRFTFFFFFFFL